MSDAQGPERLRLVGDHELERRLLEAAAGEHPSAEISARMAKAIGVSFAAPSPAGSATAVKTGAAAAKGSMLVVWSLVAAGVIVAAATALVLVTRERAAPRAPLAPAAPAVAGPAFAPAPAPAALPAPAAAVERAPAPEVSPAPPPGRRRSLSADLGPQIALLDAARTALAANSSERALEILRRYRDNYPAGAFRPEATALTVEALVTTGRVSEARLVARRFLAEFGPSPLAERVQRQAGLSAP